MKYERIRYPDGGVYARVTDFRFPIIRERINTYEDLFFIKSVKDVCDYNEIENVDLYIPTMFQQQHDQRFNDNESFELKLVADHINSCKFKRVYICHPHSSVTPALIDRSHVIDNHAFITRVLSEIGATKDTWLMSTDAGGFKPLVKLANALNWQGKIETAGKHRDPVTSKLTQLVVRQDFGGNDVLIIDDLCVYGGTFVGLAKILKERNVGKLYLAVSHITVTNPSNELNLLFDKVFTTNSKYDSYTIAVDVIKTAI